MNQCFSSTKTKTKIKTADYKNTDMNNSRKHSESANLPDRRLNFGESHISYQNYFCRISMLSRAKPRDAGVNFETDCIGSSFYRPI